MSDETPKLRLRPKLAVETSPAPAPSAVAAPPPAPENAASASAAGGPRSAEPVAPEANPVPVIRFKPRVPAATPATGPVIAAVVADPAPAVSSVPPASMADLPPSLSAAVSAPGSLPPPIPPRRSGKKVQLVAVAIGLGGVLVFALVGFLVFGRMSALTQHYAAEQSAGENVPRKRERPTIDKNEASGIAEAASPSAPTQKSPPAAATPPSTPSAASASVARPAAAAPEVPADAGNAEAQDWINKLKISGVRTGSSPKVLIGGKAFSVGDVVQANFGLVFTGYDPAREFVQFKDGKGTVYERRVR
jgi:hypothetical protein